MPVITAIEHQEHNPDRVNVDLDGRFGFGLDGLVAMARGLTVGRELSEAEIEALQRDDSIEKAHAAALNFLSYRPRSRREIEQRLARGGSDPEVIDAVISRLECSGLVDDRAFARFWIENRLSFRPRGKMALRVEMRQKGLDGDIIDEVLEALGDEEGPAYDAGRAKVRSYGSLDDREFLRRMIAHLQRRGFAYGVAAPAARRLLAERGGDVDELDEDSV